MTSPFKVTSMGPELQSQNRIDVNYKKNFWSGSLAYKTTLENQYYIDSERKEEVISSKIDQLVAIYTSKFKWAWLLRHTFQILEINLGIFKIW